MHFSSAPRFLVMLAFLCILIFSSFLLQSRLSTVSDKKSAIVAASIPGSLVADDEEISHMDAIFDDNGDVHAVWTVVNNTTSSSLPSVFYARSYDKLRQWSEPRQLTYDVYGDVQILLTRQPNQLHLLIGSRGRHWVSSDTGNTWTELTPFVPDAARRVSGLRGISDGSNLFVAYSSDSDQRSRGSLSLYRSSGDSYTPLGPLTIPGPADALSHIDDVLSRFALVGQELHLLVALSLSGYSHLYHFSSNDAGSTWTNPKDLLANENLYSEDATPSIDGLDINQTPRGFLVLYHTNYQRIHAFEYSDGRFDAVATFNPPQQRLLSAPFHVISLSSSTSSEPGMIGTLAWIDSRYTETDRRWWKPLGGWPWSDQPDWANNDIWITPIPERSQDAGSGSGAFDRFRQPMRVTSPLSYVHEVRLLHAGHVYLLVWTGKREIGKTKADGKWNEEIFFKSVGFN